MSKTPLSDLMLWHLRELQDGERAAYPGLSLGTLTALCRGTGRVGNTPVKAQEVAS